VVARRRANLLHLAPRSRALLRIAARGSVRGESHRRRYNAHRQPGWANRKHGLESGWHAHGVSGAIDIGKDGVQRSYSQPDLFITSLQPGSTPKNLTANYDYDISGGIGGDQAPPRGSGPSKPFWSKDGRFIFVAAAEEGRANLKRIDAEREK